MCAALTVWEMIEPGRTRAVYLRTHATGLYLKKTAWDPL